jgi:hypothetical protein
MQAGHCGPADEAMATLQTIKAFGNPVVDRLGVLP